MTKLKPSTHAKIDQRVKELLYPAIEDDKTYIFNSPHGRVERYVVKVENKIVLYHKPSGFGTCPLLTFQRLYQKYGVMNAS